MIIGKFKETADAETGEVSYRGGVSFGGVDLSLAIRPTADGGKVPFRIFEVPSPKYSDGECGAGFKNTRRSDGSAYLGLSIESTRLPEALNCAMMPGREAGEHVVIWNRPQRREGGEE